MSMQEKTTNGAMLVETTHAIIMYSVKEAEADTGIKYTTLLLWAKQGKIPAVRLGAGRSGKILINRDGLLRYLQTATIPDDSPPENQRTINGIRAIGGMYHG